MDGKQWPGLKCCNSTDSFTQRARSTTKNEFRHMRIVDWRCITHARRCACWQGGQFVWTVLSLCPS